MKEKYSFFYSREILIPAGIQDVYDFLDDPVNFSSHMDSSSIMMAGSSMHTETDSAGGKAVGSVIKMKGKIFGLELFLQEVIRERIPPYRKNWETFEEQKLLVVDQYLMGFNTSAEEINRTKLEVFIKFNLPATGGKKILGLLLGKFYCQWCVNRILKDTKKHFGN